jgi:hypothetical protein
MCNKKCGVGSRDYYKSVGGDIEAIDIIEMYGLGFSLGNAIKYILRAGKKGDAVEDLVKAVWYINRHMDCVNDMMCTKVDVPADVPAAVPPPAKKENVRDRLFSMEWREVDRVGRPKIQIFEENSSLGINNPQKVTGSDMDIDMS